MVGRTRRHVVRLPEDVADDSRFCLAHIEAVDADAGAGKIAIQANTGNRLDGGNENPGQLLLMCGGSGDAFVQDISNPGIETGNAGDIGRPRFKDARDSPWLFPFKGMDAVAAGDVRRHDGIAADDDASRPAGTIQRLVARKTGRRHDAVGQVDVNGTSRLGHIDDESQMVAPAILGAAGNCYAQLGQLDKAASTLLSAADKADNNTLSPIFLLQAGEILVKQGKYDDAVNAYTKIKDKYFQSYQAMDIDKYIEQAKLMKK